MKILVVRIKGLGNFILFTPTLIAIRKKFPDAKITLLADKLCAEVVNGSKLVDDIVYFNLNSRFSDKLKVLLGLRKRNFDYSILAFPAHNWRYNLFAFLIGARKRVTHGYEVANLKSLSFLQNVKVRAIEGIHDVEQNLRLLSVFDIKDVKRELYFHLSEEDKIFANDFFKGNNLKKVIGIHPGCSEEGSYKRWPKENFSEVIQMLQRDEFDVILVAGPGEEGLVEDILGNLVKKPVIVKNMPIKRVAALVSKCIAFLSTDSGIGHISAAMGVPTLALIGPGDYRRIAPYGRRCGVITNKSECSPCMVYPFKTDYSQYGHIKCSDAPCMKQITPEEVRGKLRSLITG